MAIEATIIADSLSPQSHRLTTFVLKFPRIVLAEFNTHRMISRNSASSRAIPFQKMLKMVQEDPFIPIKWMKDHSGMQGNEFFTDELMQTPEWKIGERMIPVTEAMRHTWLKARDMAIDAAHFMSKYNLTKQICNRLLEPFMWHTVITTGTEWENFFALRAHEAAEIHIQELAFKMLDAYNQHEPKELAAGEWHIPFGDQIDRTRLISMFPDRPLQSFAIKIATARCARISYNTFEGKDDYEADVKLHDRLMESGHMSPFEHCARTMTNREFSEHIHGIRDEYGLNPRDFGWSGNFQGFIQYRKLFNNENKQDGRVKKHVYNERKQSTG